MWRHLVKFSVKRGLPLSDRFNWKLVSSIIINFTLNQSSHLKVDVDIKVPIMCTSYSVGPRLVSSHLHFYSSLYFNKLLEWPSIITKKEAGNGQFGSVQYKICTGYDELKLLGQKFSFLILKSQNEKIIRWKKFR